MLCTYSQNTLRIISESPTKENTTKEEVKIQGRMATKMLHQKEDIFLPCTKVSFMVIVLHVTILDIGIDITKLVDGRFKPEMEVSTWTTMSNVTIATTMENGKRL